MIKYDKEKLTSVIEDFANITGLSIAVYDADFNNIVLYHNNDSIGQFCHALQQTETGQNLCQKSDHELFKKCRNSRCFVSHICHAGLTDAVMPIIHNETILGYIILGRLRIEKDYSVIKEKISWYGDTENLRECYSLITDYNADKVKSIGNIASIIVTHILLGDMIKQENSTITEAATNYIKNHLSENLTINRLCKALNVSKNSLYENFRINLNTTINEYITDRRIDAAKNLIASTDKQIYEIAESVGIPNYPYFFRLFKKKTGVTPLKYRKRQTK